MVDGRQLLVSLQLLRKRLEDDLRDRSEQVSDLGQRLRDEWQTARQRERTAQTYEAWRDDALAQAAVMWLLGCVFVRFLEDNALVNPPRLAGRGPRLQLARDQRTLYFQAHPHDSDREYLYSVFEAMAALPAAAPLFDHRHNPVWTIGISGDGATQLIDFWQRIDPATGALVHNFTDSEWQTRFLGDLYQDLSESARKKYALLQTPDFVLQFILDRTLTPAIAEFGFREVRLIDPACGSGHFLIAAFERLFRLWAQHEPGRNARELAQRALAQVSGVDLNPFAVAIARFRLLLGALRVSNIATLVDAPAFEMELATGDSLLHGPRPGDAGRRQMYLEPSTDPLAHVYATEDAEDLKRILGRRYHIVVGNPPYITPKDAALNKAYRDRFGSCHMKYSLAVPFTERMFDLAIGPAAAESSPAGYVGMITANSFMKREFGRKLVERFFPGVDLTHIIDTERAYIPGHTTHTVILFGRNRAPLRDAFTRVVMGIRREKGRPDDPARGLVWTAILAQVDTAGSKSQFISVSDNLQELIHKFPWSIGGGGAAELKEQLESVSSERLGSIVDSIGITAFTLEDDIFLLQPRTAERLGIPAVHQRPMVEGDAIRDWQVGPALTAVFPYDKDYKPFRGAQDDSTLRYLWPGRTCLANNKMFGGKTKLESGLQWFEWGRLTAEKLRVALSIAFAEVATHNHFALARGGMVFKQTAPVIKLLPDASDDEHLSLTGFLNSSVACFWIKQVCPKKGGTGLGGGIYDEEWEFFYQINATKLHDMPTIRAPLAICRELDGSGSSRTISIDVDNLDVGVAPKPEVIGRAIALQEELDWHVYGAFNLLNEGLTFDHSEVPTLNLGERAFEIFMARQLAAGVLETTWFERHGSTPITEIPYHWPDDYKRVVENRIREIESNGQIALIEQPEYKRRWNIERWQTQVDRALRTWLLDRLESGDYWVEMALTSVARLADRACRDDEFMRVAATYKGEDTFDVATLIAELVDAESVPFLPVLRYGASGVRKRELWERTWHLQRLEDAIDARTLLEDGDPKRLSEESAKRLKDREVGTIPIPPKYTSADFARSSYWRLRGKLDVQKERFISYPHCQRDADPTPVIAWAGWNHLQQAKALATYYIQMKESEGWSKERLIPLLAGLVELLPWLVQWHNKIDSEYGQRMGEFYEGFVDEEMRALGFTHEAIRAWTPPPGARRRGRRPQQRTTR